MSISKGIYIVGARRTAFGSFGGKLKNKTVTDLSEIAARSALASANVAADLVDSVIVGMVQPSAADSPYIARHTALRVGTRIETPSLCVNRLCGSGFQAIVSGVQEILLGQGDITLCVGSENMSQSPYQVRGVRFGTALGQDIKFEDSLWAALTDAHVNMPMAITAENLAEKYGISRQDCDAYALKTQMRWKNAHENGYFKEEIEPITIKGKKGDETFDTDEHARPSATLENLAKLPAIFKKNGTVTAGNASGVCDGAAALVLASEEAIAKHNLTPLARLVSYGYAGCDPTIMGIGPVLACKLALKAANKQLSDIDLTEVNEAFAAQYLAVEKELGLNPDTTNVDGGAIAVGHPLGASGTRITSHLTHELRRRGVKYGMGSACIGGGQGIALILESV